MKRENLLNWLLGMTQPRNFFIVKGHHVGMKVFDVITSVNWR